MQKKRVAVLGSSGGHLFSLGGNDPEALLGDVRTQLEAGGMEIAAIQFTACSKSLDNADKNTPTRLITEGVKTPERLAGTLAEINEAAVPVDKEIAEMIRAGVIDGVILISADPNGANREAIAAAAEKKLPVVGTGGTAVATAKNLGANVVSMSGTTGTTNRTRAVGYAAALAKEWQLTYRPVIGKQTTAGGGGKFNLRGIMVAAMPAFIAMALLLAIGKIPNAGVFGDMASVLITNLPLVVAVIAARQVSGMDDLGIVAGAVAGALAVGSSAGLIGGIIGGSLAGFLVPKLLVWSFQRNFPSTTANIVAGGVAGLVSGLVVYLLLAPFSLALGNGIRAAIDWAIALSPVLAGALAGLLIWPAIIGGVYHAAILPIVLLEMETTGNSFLGAVDMVSLVMVSAGITLANMIGPRNRSEAAVAAPGFAINMGFGTFVEAAYPFMFSDRRVFGTALFAATLAGATVGLFGVRGTAYVPSPVAPALANNPLGMVIAMAVGLVAALLPTLLINRLAKGQGSQQQTDQSVSA